MKKTISNKEILKQVPRSWGDRTFTDEERISLWNGNVIYSGAVIHGRGGHTYRMYFVLHHNKDADKYQILHRVDHPTIHHLGVKPFGYTR